MGCDIHAHVEIKVNGQWHHYNHPAINRSYDLFARMADVRNDGSVEPISKPRGLPEDITFTTRFDRDHDGSDGHSDSWLSAKEIVTLGDWYEEKQKQWNPSQFYNFERTVGYIFGNGWELALDGIPQGLEDARLVFWFDN